MKGILALLLSTTLTLTAFAQTEIETIKKAKELIAEKKYASAFKVLDRFDSKNAKPSIVLIKEDIALNYFVSSIMHQMFGLKDLEKNENVMDYRGKDGSYNMQMFPVNKILDSLIKIYPNNCGLYKGLGEYYYEVHLKYEGQWLKNDTDLFGLMETNFKKAIKGSCADYLSYYVLGYITLSQKLYQESIQYFLKSIEMNKQFASAYYNLAYAYLFTDDRKNALKYAKSSFDMYDDQTYKSDAARMLGQIYVELKDNKNAMISYALADKIDPGNYYNLKPLLTLYVEAGDKNVNEALRAFFNLEPTNPTIYNDLDEIFYTNKKESDLTAFYKTQLSVFKDNDKVQGNLNFYLAKIYLGTDKKLANEYFIKSKEIFSRVYDKDHQVFKAIEDGIRQTEK